MPAEGACNILPKDAETLREIRNMVVAHISGLYNFYNFEDDFYIEEDRLP